MSSLFPLSLLMGLILGVSAHRAGLCTVKAVAEVMTSRRGWVLWSFLKASLWIAGLTALAGVAGIGIGLRQWPLQWQGLLGGLIFGLGAGANGACSFSTLTRLAEGHGAMLFTLAGWPLGMAGLHQLLPHLHRMRRPYRAGCCWGWDPRWHGRPGEAGKIMRRLRAEGWGQLRAAHWPLSLSVALVAVANFGILASGGSWSFTSTLICAAGAAPLANCAHAAFLWLVSLAALAGMLGSALVRGSFRLRRIRAAAALRHGLSGVAMGVGAVLLPGGNDGLILFGLPALSPHALPGGIAIVVGTALALAVLRLLGRPIAVVRCEADICRASM